MNTETETESGGSACATKDVFCDEAMKDDTPGVRGEVMLVNTDSFEECNQDLDTLYSGVGNVFGNNSDSHVFKDEKNDAEINQDEAINQGEEIDQDKEINEDTDVNQDGSIDKETPALKPELFSSLNIASSSSDLFEDASYEVPPKETFNDEEYFGNPLWLEKEKHIFILSESGKPIYSRYGKEDRLVTLFGLMQALVSIVADGDDTIRCITAGGHKFVFLVRSPLILVTVSHSTASIPQLLMQLIYVHSHIVSVLTASRITRIFEKRRNYDFRNMLGGTERILDNLLCLLDEHPSYLLGAIQCLPLSSSVRDTITQTIIQYCSKIKNLVFGLIICDNQLISLVRMKTFLLHPHDLHLIFNLVSSTESLKTSENWMPICLPKFDSNGYLYGHVSYLTSDCDACLVLLSVDRQQFYTLSEAKQKIVDKLRRHHCLEKINQSMKSSTYNVQSLVSPELRHFVYKSRSTAQFTSPVYTVPYNSIESQKRLFGLYQLLHHRIHFVSRPLKMMFIVTATETLVGWVTKEFELYTVLDPLTSKSRSVSAVSKILQWIKNEENRLFILSSPTF